MRRSLAALAYSALVLALLTGGAVASAQAAPDWSSVPQVTITTTDGPAAETFTLQGARVGDQVFFRVQFNYTGANNAGLVFFAIELGRSMNVTTPMSEGDEMMIASQKGPDGKTPGTYDYYLSSTESEPDPIIPGSVTVQSVDVVGSHYEMVFSRPMTTDNPDQQVQIQTGQPVKLAFAVSEWGLESSHAYTWLTYQMNVTQDAVSVTPYHPPSGGGQVIVPSGVMMITPAEAAVEATAIFLLLFAAVFYLGTRRIPKKA